MRWRARNCPIRRRRWLWCSAARRVVSQNRNSKIAEMVIDAGEMMVSGSKTVQVEVKE